MAEEVQDPLVALVASERQKIRQAQMQLQQTAVGARHELPRTLRYAPDLSGDVVDVGNEAANLKARYGGQDYEETPIVGSGSFLSKLGNALGAPARFVTSGLHEALYDKDPNQSALEAAASGFWQPHKGKLGGDIFREAGLPRLPAAALGFGADVALDPLTYIGGAAIGAVGKGLGAIGTKLAPGALGALKLSAPGRAMRYAFQPGARLEDLGLKASMSQTQRLLGKGRALEKLLEASPEDIGKALPEYSKAVAGLDIASRGETFNKVREAQLALPSHVAKGQSQLLKDIQEVPAEAFKTLGNYKGLAASASAAKKRGLVAPEEAMAAKQLLRRGFNDPQLQAAKTFYDRYKRYMGTASEKAEYERIWQDVAAAANKTQEGIAKSRLGQHIMGTLTRAEERRFAQSINQLKMSDGSPLVWKRPHAVEGVVPARPPMGYVRLGGKRRRAFGSGAYVPQLFADELRDMPHLGDLRGFAKAMSNSAIGRAWDRMTGRWKAIVTGLNPSFNVRNFSSNQYNIFQSEGIGAISPDKILRGDTIRRGASGTVMGPGGKKWSYEEVRNLLMDAGAYRSGQVSEDIDKVLRDITEGKVGQFEHKLIENVHGIPVLKHIAGRMAGDAIEDAAKTQLFVHSLEKTGDVQKSLDKVRKVLFDYGDITYFERHYMKRLIPFYTWMRKNAPLQVEFLMQNPARAGGIFKLQREAPIAALSQEERDREQRQLKTEGIEQRLGIPTNAEAGGYRYALPAFVPLGEVGDITDPVGALSQRMHPFLGTAFDKFIRGRESFRDIPFQTEEGIPTEVKASPIAAALANMGVGLPGVRQLPGRLGAAGLPEVRQTLESQKLEQLLPLLLSNIPVAGLPAAAIAGGSWGRGAAGALFPQGGGQSWDAVARFAGLPFAVSEPSAPLRAKAHDLNARLRAYAARRKAAEGR